MIESVTSLERGTQSEHKLILQLLKFGISPKAIFHDLYFPAGNGKYSQSDIVVATKVGIIVFEVKDYSGWIFGNGNYRYWTQVLSKGKYKYKFYNPIKQNQKHIEVIKRQLTQLNNIPFYSVIVFYGNCKLKQIQDIPNNVFLIYNSDITLTLKSILSNIPAPYTNKYDIVTTLKQGVKNGQNLDIVISHISSVANYSFDTDIYNWLNNSL